MSAEPVYISRWWITLEKRWELKSEEENCSRENLQLPLLRERGREMLLTALTPSPPSLDVSYLCGS